MVVNGVVVVLFVVPVLVLIVAVVVVVDIVVVIVVVFVVVIVILVVTVVFRWDAIYLIGNLTFDTGLKSVFQATTSTFFTQSNPSCPLLLV